MGAVSVANDVESTQAAEILQSDECRFASWFVSAFGDAHTIAHEYLHLRRQHRSALELATASTAAY